MDKNKLIDALKGISIPLEKKTKLIDAIDNSIKEEIQNSKSNDFYYTIIFNDVTHTLRVESQNINLNLADNVNYNYDSEYGKYVIKCTVNAEVYAKLKQNKCVTYIVKSDSTKGDTTFIETYYKVANKTINLLNFVLNIGDNTNAAIVFNAKY